MKQLNALSLLFLCASVLAQEPAVDTSAAPAVDTSRRLQQPPSSSATAPTNSGTTIVGERESPIGLYIMPWRNSGPEQGIDRPARLLEEEALPLDPGTFRRQLDYYSALTAHKQAIGTTPAP